MEEKQDRKPDFCNGYSEDIGTASPLKGREGFSGPMEKNNPQGNEESSREFEEFTESILQNITGGLLTVDLEENVTFFNRAAEKMLGLGAADVVGKHMETLFDLGEGQSSWVTESLKTGEVFHQKETVMLKRGGERVQIGISTAPLRDRDNQTIGVLASFVDLSQVAKLREQKARRELLMTLGEMSAVIAHKVRNPLASIKLGMQLLRKDLSPSSSQTIETVDLIDQEVDKIERIIEELLNVVHPRDMNMTETDLKDVIAKSQFAVSKEIAGKRIMVVQEYHAALPPILADPGQLEQVFYSVFTNAIDAMETGGELAIRGSLGPDGNVQVEIKDNGEGIPPENLSKIFDPFFTTKANGTGLGLCLARQIIEAHNGTISASSRPGQGTTFTMTCEPSPGGVLREPPPTGEPRASEDAP
jgi:PAS domain S-box-containing protein